MFLQRLQAVMSIIAFIALGFLAGASYREVHAEPFAPEISLPPAQIVPQISVTNITPDYLELSTSTPELRFFTDASVLVPDAAQQIRIPLPASSFCTASTTPTTEACTFVARSTGRVYYRGDSTQGKKIPTESRRCFATQTSAEQAGFQPSSTL